MTTLLTSVCKYSMIIVMILYTVLAFWSLRYKSVENMRGCYWGMNLLTFSFLTLGFAVIAVKERNILIVGYYAAIMLYFMVYLLVYRHMYKKANLALLSHMLMFLSIGFILLTRLNPKQSIKQYIIVVGSSVLTLIVPKMFAKLKAARNWAIVMGIIGILMLGIVLVFQIVGASTLKMSELQAGDAFQDFVGPLGQPSEFVKISFVLLIAVLLRERTDIKRVLLSAVIAAVHGIILVASRDLGAALIFFVSYLMMLYVATKQKAYLFIGLIVGFFACIAAYYLFAHVRVRVQTWLHPFADFYGKGNQIGNSLFGIGTGGWFGQGLYKGQPSKTPEVIMDCIFTAVCEELGGIIGICLILICIACLLMFIAVAAELYLPFYKLIGIGLTAIYGTQVFLTIGGGIKFIPLTGVTLPLVSYGGSSVLSTFIIFGIMQELYIKRQNEVERLERIKERVHY